MRRVVVPYVLQLFFEVIIFQIYFGSTLLALWCLAVTDWTGKNQLYNDTINCSPLEVVCFKQIDLSFNRKIVTFAELLNVIVYVLPLVTLPLDSASSNCWAAFLFFASFHIPRPTSCIVLLVVEKTKAVALSEDNEDHECWSVSWRQKVFTSLQHKGCLSTRLFLRKT